MKEVRLALEFEAWLERLRDKQAMASIVRRLRQLGEGNFGDHKRLKGLIELRLHQGPGYRLYCVERGATLVVVLAGGDKSTQEWDIRKALRLAELH